MLASQKPVPSEAAPIRLGTITPKRSLSLPASTLPMPKPIISRVKGSEASARDTPNSACTAGSTTEAVHMPQAPMVVSVRFAASRSSG